MTKYMTRLILFSLISMIPYYAIEKVVFNGVLTITFCVGMLVFFIKIKNQILKYVSVVSFCVLSVLLQLEWAPFAVILALLIYLYYDDKFSLFAFYTISLFTVLFFTVLFMGAYNEFNSIYMIGCLLPLPLLQVYNGKKGLDFKWAFYLIYPTILGVFVFLNSYLTKWDICAILYRDILFYII